MEQTIVHINSAYFPAWQAVVDTNKVPLQQNDKGMQIIVSKGKHELELHFNQTSIEKLANAISLLSFVTLFIGIIVMKKKRLFL